MGSPTPDESPVRPSSTGHCGPAQNAPIIVGIDGGPGTRLVLEAAAEAAELTDALLVVVHAATQVHSAGYPAVIDATLPQDWEVALFPDVVEALADRNVRWNLVAENGDPAYVLRRLATELGARSIVIGSHTPGLAGRIRAIAGHSVTDRLVRCAAVPVYVVPCHSATPGA